MRVEALDYELPQELIAQRPAGERDASRMLVLRGNEPPLHRHFHELPELLRPGDLLVLNDTRVLPARLRARRETGGEVELLLVEPVPGSGDRWRALARPARRVRPGERLRVGGEVEVEVIEALADGSRVVAFGAGIPVIDVLERHGRMPLPPYIDPEDDERRAALDSERYQTVYAAVPGAVAAPTAGLHFTPALLERLADAGIQLASLTLHVGPGTFRPVSTDEVDDHAMDAERYVVPGATADAVIAARREGRRVIAVGTTAVRALEHAFAAGPPFARRDDAALFIKPGYRFRAVDGMITNFHLPRSTPILLVAALVGLDRLLGAYREAVRERYRFYSYGDAMLVLPAPTPRDPDVTP